MLSPITPNTALNTSPSVAVVSPTFTVVSCSE